MIDGLLYDTETAEVVGEDSYSTANDFDYYEEKLYKTRRGRWFVAGQGGPRSHYGRATGNNAITGGSGLRTLTEREAQQWCERAQIDGSIVAGHFGVEEG